MGAKKNRERFSIKFNENDPAHAAVIRLLEKQGPHSKAQFLVNAVLHYINCPEAPEVVIPQETDRTAIEKIVMEILNRREKTSQTTADTGRGAERAWEQGRRKPEKKADGEQPQEEMDEMTFALIADTMSAFRSS